MSTRSEHLLQQASVLLEQARMLPVDECAQVLERIVTMAQAAQAEALAAGQLSGELADSGCVSVRGFATTVLRRSGSDASMLGTTTVHLRDFPLIATAYREGRVSTPNLRAVLSHRRQCGLSALQEHEEALLVLATEAGPEEIRRFCHELVEVARPDADRGPVEVQGDRLVRVARVGHLAHLDAMLDPQVGEQLQATLAAMARAARNPDDPQPYAVRAADALEHLLQHGMDAADLPSSARHRPHVRLTVDVATLLGLPGHGRALLERFGLIPDGTAQRISCDALVQLVVADGDRVLNVGRTQRVVTDRQHAALAATHRTCATPGCAIRFSDCDVHHLWWWSLGGPTDLDLQVPLCRSHHRSVHDGVLSLSREDGELVFRDRRGRVLRHPGRVLDQQLALLHPHQLVEPSVAALVDATATWPRHRYRQGVWGSAGRHADDGVLSRSP